MKIETLFVEEKVINDPYAERIIRFFPNVPLRPIDKLERIFDAVKRPHSPEKEGLRIFIGEKKGMLVKRAPVGYGVLRGEHYYYVHAYNCLYACEYCYLQGYFHSPDLVFFVNHEDIIDAMERTLGRCQSERVWFHGGEFSDSLALSHITGELPLYWSFFKNHPDAFLEIRTKSSNVKAVKDLEPLRNVVISYSLSPEKDVSLFDKRTPSLRARLQAIRILIERGFQVSIHLDPVIIREGFIEDYEGLIRRIMELIPMDQLAYVSLGVVRFTKKVHREVRRNHPKTALFEEALAMHQGKIRVSLPRRNHALEQVKKMLIERGVPQKKIYLCMEENPC